MCNLQSNLKLNERKRGNSGGDDEGEEEEEEEEEWSNARDSQR